MTTYRIAQTTEAKRLLAPMTVGQTTSIAVVRNGANVYTARGVEGTVVKVWDNGYSADIAYHLPADHYAL